MPKSSLSASFKYTKHNIEIMEHSGVRTCNWIHAHMNSQRLRLEAQSLNQVNTDKIPKLGEGNGKRS